MRPQEAKQANWYAVPPTSIEATGLPTRGFDLLQMVCWKAAALHRFHR